jgi:hypothetical protein
MSIAGPPIAGPPIAGPPIAGYVSAIGGRTTGCSIVRGKKELPARYWADLLVGDEIVARDDCQIEIMPRDGPRRWTVMAANSPTAMTGRAKRLTGLPKSLEPVGLALNKWNDDLLPALPPRASPKTGKPTKQAAPPTPANPAGPQPLALPLLTGGVRQRLVAMPRRFNFGWIGGKPPFTVIVLGPEPDGQAENVPAEPSAGPPVATCVKRQPVPQIPSAVASADASTRIFEIGDERLVSSEVDLRPGTYEVRITDAACASARGEFDAVEATPMVDDNDLAGLPIGIGVVLAAARLSNSDFGVWRMEAHARLAEEGRENYAAALMALRLLAGKSLPDASLRPDPSLRNATPAVTAASSVRDAEER